MSEPVATGGTVYLVGAGPGDPELLTLRARRVIDDADAILYDSLVGDRIVESLPAGTLLRDVGKKPDDEGERPTQAEINRHMATHARAGRAVVRLKGGDPSVFARGGEEAQYLAGEGIPFEVIPGVTSVVAAPGVAGIPLTHRDHVSAVTVITGHEHPDKDESALDWDALAGTIRRGGTLVILMGVRTLPENVAALRAHGVSSKTPAAMIEKATWDAEQTVVGSLETIVDDADRAGIESPAVTVVGEVVDARVEPGPNGTLGRSGPPRQHAAVQVGPQSARGTRSGSTGLAKAERARAAFALGALADGDGEARDLRTRGASADVEPLDQS